jgi:hypothetical protein
MTGDAYQSSWGSIPDNDAAVSAIPLPRMPSNTGEVESKLASRHIVTMASGELPNEFKFFLYAQDAATSEMFLIQANVEKSADPLLILTVKSHTSVEVKQALIELITQALN